VEARLYAEDPDRDFLPSTGRVEIFDLAAEDGVRIDSGVREGDEASPFYDPMLAKVIAHGASRRQALERLSHALAGSLVAGPKTNLGLLRGLVANEAFQSGQYDTGLIETRLDELLERPAGFKDAAVALGVLRLLERDREEIETRRMARSNERFSPWCASDGFQLGPPRSVAVAVTADGQACDIPVVWEAGEPAVIVPEDSGDWPELDARIVESASGVLVVADGWQIAVSRRGHAADEPDADDGDIAVRAPMHGRLVSLRVAEGDVVEKGSKLAVVEAMKMEHMLIAPRAGRIAGIAVAPGAQVAEGQRLLTLRAQSTSPPD
jgi:3-methylcrotonyl-CoA carboxylase alpha subunit